MEKKVKLEKICKIMVLSALALCLMVKAKAYAKDNVREIDNQSICLTNLEYKQSKNIIKGISHKKVTRRLNGKPAVVNIITVNPHLSKTVIKPTYGEYFLNEVKSVMDFASKENAIAAVNASFFKPDIGAPLGMSIIDGEVLTGPIYNRVVFGIKENNEFLMDKLNVAGEISIGDELKLDLFNYNQPVFSRYSYTIFTDRWGEKTPPTSEDFCHIMVRNDKVELIKQSSIDIPKDGYVILGPRRIIKNRINKGDKVSYSMKITPGYWSDVKYAVGGGPYLVKNGKIFVDRQRFTDKFLWKKEPRTAIGYSRAGTLIIVTVDGRRKGVSEGATMPELAQIMWELGAYNAMNLDGGSSTQMVYKGELVNMPTVKGGGKVTNALLILPASIYH